MKKRGKHHIRAKSYTSIYDIFRKNLKPKCKNIAEVTVCQAVCGDKILDGKILLNPFVTSERYHSLNKNYSLDHLGRSTSTLFYDLDEIARKQSLHYLLGVKDSTERPSGNITKKKGINGFNGKSNLIVQECATQMHPKSQRDSTNYYTKGFKRHFPNDLVLSSEIFLTDNNYDNQHTKRYFDKEVTSQHQKFWSYAKYRAEYGEPIPEEKKSKKKKDRGKRIENPCPCQLFSYTCPCTNEQSCTEVDKTNQSVNVSEQTSTTKLKEIKHRSRRNKNRSIPKENKHISASFETNSPVPKVEQVVQAVIQQNSEKKIPNTKFKNKEKSCRRQFVCPNCKEKVEVKSSTDEADVEKIDPLAYDRPFSTTAACSYRNTDSLSHAEEYCPHSPPCELIPCCQIVPQNAKFKRTATKSRVVRITKACRHHPPCTVVPSCQRGTVLKNNCEFIPPCLHHPRCVNLPLCVPMSKTYNLDDFSLNQLDIRDSSDCPHQRKIVPLYPDTIENEITPQYDLMRQVQNTCEVTQKYNFKNNVPAHTICLPNDYAPYKVVSQGECSMCKLTKSCQYDLPDHKSGLLKESVSDAVIFIRDVGCQFRNRTVLTPRQSLSRLKSSSDSTEYLNDRKGYEKKVGHYYDTLRTLRYADKYTAPSKVTLCSFSSTVSTTDVDFPNPLSDGTTGFRPRDTTQYVAFTANSKPIDIRKYEKRNKCSLSYRTRSVKSRNKIKHLYKRKTKSVKSQPRKNNSALENDSSTYLIF